MDIKYKLRRRRENFDIWLANRLPKRLVMRVYFRVLAHATTGKYGNTIVPEITAMDVIDRFCKDNEIY